MALRGFVKNFLPSGWLYGEVEDLQNQNKTIFKIIKTLYAKRLPEREESFEQAMKRLNLTEEYVKRTASIYRLYAICFLILAIAIFGYGFYLLFAHLSFSGCLLAIASTGLCLAQAFRFDFWAYQMKVRRLGVTFNEWKQSILGDKGTSI